MRDSIRRLLPPLLIVAIVASLWALADSQRPAANRFQISWRDLDGKLKTGNPYARDLPTWPPRDFFDAETAEETDTDSESQTQFTAFEKTDFDAVDE